MTRGVSRVRLGLFVVLGIVAVVLAVFIVGSQEGLFGEMFSLTTYFDSAEGVRSGATVRLAGVDIGVVDYVEISAVNNRVRIDMKLQKKVMGFIKKDSYATIEPEGVVGNKFVAITVGSPASEKLEDGDIIQSKEPVRLSVILEDAQLTVANTQRATKEFANILESVNKGKGTIGKLVTDEGIYRELLQATASTDSALRKTTEEFTNTMRFIFGFAEQIGGIVYKADTIVTTVSDILVRINRGEGTLGVLLAERSLYDSLGLIIQNAIKMTEEAKHGASKFAENMEALKHNWLFKGYFEDRGYWDKADFEKELDEKIVSLKKLQADVNKQFEELRTREEQLRQREAQGKQQGGDPVREQGKDIDGSPQPPRKKGGEL